VMAGVKNQSSLRVDGRLGSWTELKRLLSVASDKVTGAHSATCRSHVVPEPLADAIPSSNH
jgi:hypothetical protein